MEESSIEETWTEEFWTEESEGDRAALVEDLEAFLESWFESDEDFKEAGVESVGNE